MPELEKTIAWSAADSTTNRPVPCVRAQTVKSPGGPQGLNLYPGSALLGMDLESFRWQEPTFPVLNLALLPALLWGQALFAEHFGTPTLPLVSFLSTGFLIQLGEPVWRQTHAEPLDRDAVRTLTLFLIAWDVALASHRGESGGADPNARAAAAGRKARARRTPVGRNPAASVRLTRTPPWVATGQLTRKA